MDPGNVVVTGQVGALDGVKIVEFSQNAAVPECGRLLAGLGADVVKVEPPTGDSMRHLAKLTDTESRAYSTINPGKRGICLDLGADDAPEIVDALLAWADVSLLGLKLSDLERYGLSWEHARAINPRLVQLELSAFGPEGPDADQGGYDVLVQGLSGIGFSMNRCDGGAPIVTRPAFIDFASGATAAFAVVTALRHSEATGVGQRVDASLLGTAMMLGTAMFTMFDVDRESRAEVMDDISLLRQGGADFAAQRSHYESRVVAGAGAFALYFRHYMTSDGLISIAGMSPGLMAKFHEITGIDHPPADRDPTTPAFQAVVAAAEKLFASQPTEAWLTTLRDAGYPCSRYNMGAESIEDPQVRANNYVVDLEHPELGTYTTVNMPFDLDETVVGITEPSPGLGQHTREVFEAAGVRQELIDKLAP